MFWDKTLKLKVPSMLEIEALKDNDEKSKANEESLIRESENYKHNAIISKFNKGKINQIDCLSTKTDSWQAWNYIRRNSWSIILKPNTLGKMFITNSNRKRTLICLYVEEITI